MNVNKVIDACLAVHPLLETRWNRAYLEKNPQTALFETAAFAVAHAEHVQDVDAYAVVREALREHLAPLLSDANAQQARRARDARFWGGEAGALRETFLLAYKKAKRGEREGLKRTYDKEIERLRAEFDTKEAA